MTMRQTSVGHLKTFAGIGFIGVGLFLVYLNLGEAAVRWSRFAGADVETVRTFGGFVSVGLAEAQVYRCWLFDRGELLRGLCGILVLFWPLLLAGAGAGLLAADARTERENIQNKLRELSN
jgi:hypothetical protein